MKNKDEEGTTKSPYAHGKPTPSTYHLFEDRSKPTLTEEDYKAGADQLAKLRARLGYHAQVDKPADKTA